MPFSIRPATAADEAVILSLADRLADFGPATRAPGEIVDRERVALAEALAHPAPGTLLLVADLPRAGVAGVILLETRCDYFTDRPHGHVAILAVSREAEGQGVGRALLGAAEDWARREGLDRLTLTVFSDNERARTFYRRQGWQPELETWHKAVGD